AVATGTMRQPKVYQATAQIILEPQMPNVLGAADLANADSGGAERTFANTQFKIITGHAVLRDAVVSLNLTTDQAFMKAYGLGGGSPDDVIKAAEGVLERSVKVQ